MKIKKFTSEEAWLDARRGMITGTNAKEVMPKTRGEGFRTGYYELIAARLAIPHDGENVMDRGKRLEEEAIERFNKETGKKAVHTPFTLCVREDNPDIGYSPDALIGKTEDVEVKCRSSATHIEVLLSEKIPSEHMSQIIQGFVVNDKLKKRHVVFYDPRFPVDFHYITVKREEVQKEVDEYLALEKQALERIKEIEARFTF